MRMKKNIALLLVVTMVTSLFQVNPVYAKEIENLSENDANTQYEVSETINGEWEDGYISTVTIRNTGNAVLEDWTAELAMNSAIDDIWNGVIDNQYVTDNGVSYIISNAGYNADIQPGDSISFGFVANGDAADAELDLIIVDDASLAGKDIQEILEADGVSEEEMQASMEYAKTAAASEQGMMTRGAAGAIKSAVKKTLKFLVKHADVIPSKTVRDAFKKYGGKIVDAIDTVDTWTWYGIARALTAVGVPDNVADMIADFIVTWVL